MVLRKQSGSGDEGASLAPHQPIATNPEGTQSEREEALWCQVVLLRERISRLEKDLMLRDELIALLRDLKRPKGPKPKPHPAVLIPKGYHKCGKPECGTMIPKDRTYCCRAHSAQQRWELRKQKQGGETCEPGLPDL